MYILSCSDVLQGLILLRLNKNAEMRSLDHFVDKLVDIDQSDLDASLAKTRLYFLSPRLSGVYALKYGMSSPAHCS